MTLHRMAMDPAGSEAVTKIILPTLHADQVKAYRMPGRFKAVRCGRRWGKDTLINTIAGDGGIKGRSIGLFAPEYKQLIEPFDALNEMLDPLIIRSSRNDGVMKLRGGGNIDFWHVNDNELAGRGREYDFVLMNETAFAKPIALDVWKKSIRPTLLIRRGKAMLLSTPKGIDPDNLFYKACTDPELGFKEYHAPSDRNPLVSAEDFEEERRANSPLVFQQEYLAEFVDWSGASFFDKAKLLGPDGAGIAVPTKCDGVFAIIDTAIKTGKKNDGTAVIYFARNRIVGAPLIILDWEVLQIEGSLLERWLPTVYQNLESWAKRCGARHGSLGAFIEDKASGMILIQQAKRRGWPVTAIDGALTAIGKDERAISVSGYAYRAEIKVTCEAADKTTSYKETTRNHLLGQVLGFRIGDKDATREDDLLDCFCYGAAIALGDGKGF